MINQSINRGKTDEAIVYLEAAIVKDPNNAQYYDVLWQVYETLKNEEGATVNLKKSLEIEPDNVETLSHIGRVYFNLGVEARSAADSEKDDKLYKELYQKSLDYFKLAMPHFEKIHAINSQDRNTIYILRSIYYSLDMNAQYEKMDAIFNSLDK
jgi:tetratricopeptide (TPR) repeat protein